MADPVQWKDKQTGRGNRLPELHIQPVSPVPKCLPGSHWNTSVRVHPLLTARLTTLLSLLGWRRVMEKSQPNPSCWAEQGNKKKKNQQQPGALSSPQSHSLAEKCLSAWSELTCSGSGWALWHFHLSSHSMVNVLLLISPQLLFAFMDGSWHFQCQLSCIFPLSGLAAPCMGWTMLMRN